MGSGLEAEGQPHHCRSAGRKTTPWIRAPVAGTGSKGGVCEMKCPCPGPWAVVMQVWGHHPPPNGVDGAASTVEQSVGHQLDTPVDVAVGGWVGGC